MFQAIFPNVAPVNLPELFNSKLGLVLPKDIGQFIDSRVGGEVSGFLFYLGEKRRGYDARMSSRDVSEIHFGDLGFKCKSVCMPGLLGREVAGFSDRGYASILAVRKNGNYSVFIR